MKKIIDIFKKVSGYTDEAPEAAPKADAPRPHAKPDASRPHAKPDASRSHQKDASRSHQKDAPRSHDHGRNASHSKPKAQGSGKGFAELGLAEEIVRAVREEGYETPTPIQLQSVPYVLEGRDLLGCAQTGTGKTAAFAMPLLQRLSRQGRGLRALILTPTRELAIQVADSFKTYGRFTDLKTVVVYGGVGIEPQKRALAASPDILVATPGRLLDLMGQRSVSLHNISVLVLDEADRMLDMGFIRDVRKIIDAVPKKRQTLLFSATMPRDIQELAMAALNNPAKVEVTPVASTSEQITQSLYYVRHRDDKRQLLLHILGDATLSRVLVFTRTKAIANRVSELLKKNHITAEAIHGNKSQSARQRALESFRAGKTRVLVASDLAARGLDIDEVSHVINFDLPNIAETYVHRIGRTGRAEHRGLAISFCAGEERSWLRDIEALIRRKVPVVTGHPYEPEGGIPKEEPPPAQGGGGGGRGRRPGGHGGGRPQGQGGGGRSRRRGGRARGRPPAGH